MSKVREIGEIEKLKLLNSFLIKELNQFKNENNKLKQENEILKSEREELKDKNEKLMAEKITLISDNDIKKENYEISRLVIRKLRLK